MSRCIFSWRQWVRTALAVAAAATASLAFGGSSWAQDELSIKRGMAIYSDIANCDFCHGWTGKGERVEDEGFTGASLVLADFDRETLIEIVRCGRPDSPMPRFGRTAWNDSNPCYGMVKADLIDASMVEPKKPLRYGTWLRDEQIELVVDYITAFYIGGIEMTFEMCEQYNGTGSRVCERFK